jgi:hypothetical protein
MSGASPELVNGQSNGFVSFRAYPAFLQTYLRGVSAIGGLNDNNQIVNFSLLASAPTTIAAHSIDIVTNGVNTIIYANASGAVENLGSIENSFGKRHQYPFK